MDWEVLIPILMFAFPVVVALLDKRAKQKKAASRPAPRQSFPSMSAAPESLPRKRPTASDPSQPFGWAPPSYDAEGGTVSLGRPSGAATQEYKRKIKTQDVSEEGVRAIQRKEENSPQPQEPADKLKIDKKKLIIYSEILKPKWES